MFCLCSIKQTDAPAPAATPGKTETRPGRGGAEKSLCSLDSYTEACETAAEIGDLLGEVLVTGAYVAGTEGRRQRGGVASNSEGDSIDANGKDS